MMIISFLGGFIAGLIADTDGSVFVPLFVELDMNPLVSMATGMYISIYYSLGNTTIYIIEGYFDDYYLLVFIPIALIAAILGMLTNDRIVKRFNRHSILIFFLSATLAAAAVTCTYQIMNRVYQTSNNGRTDSWSFGNY